MTSLPTWPSTNESFVPWVYLERNPNEIPVLIGQKTLFLEGVETPLKIEDIHSPRRFQQVGPTSLHRQATQKGTFTRALRLSKFQVGSCCHALCVLGGTGCASGKKRWNWWWVSWWVGDFMSVLGKKEVITCSTNVTLPPK